MTYSDEERREVAEKLRKLKGLAETLPSEFSIGTKAAVILENVLDCMDYDAAESGDFFECLADLIDQPRVAYCPSCGREVVAE